MTMPTATITIANDLKVTIPASLQLMTPYILKEQNGWFEDEITFLRCLIKPGMKAVDIGANYGLYTMTIAQLAGDSGEIWAFEPTKSTAGCLNESISKNNFSNIKLIQAGLSDKIGKAIFYTNPNAELNSLTRSPSQSGDSESVLLLTLDHCAKKYNWDGIDFIKLDAEGEEAKILSKGKNFLAAQSPLIMFELKHGQKVNTLLINRFKNMGYESYRLIPGLDILVKFDPDEKFDRYLLNLFCCKKDKAEKLMNDGIIVDDWENAGSCEYELMMESIGSLPYAKEAFADKEMYRTDRQTDYRNILCNYTASKAKGKSSRDRVSHLMTALKNSLHMVENGENSVERIATFARIAFDAGEREHGVAILSEIINRHTNGPDFSITDLFMPACESYDHVSPNQEINKWLFSSVLEAYIKKHAYSTYFSGKATLPVFELLIKLGFMSVDMQRTYQLIQKRFANN